MNTLPTALGVLAQRLRQFIDGQVAKPAAPSVPAPAPQANVPAPVLPQPQPAGEQARIRQLKFADVGEFGAPRQPSSRPQTPTSSRPAPTPEAVQQLVSAAVGSALGLSSERLAEPGMQRLVEQWKSWGSNRLLQHGGDAARAGQALASDILRDPQTAAVLVRELKQSLVQAFDRGNLPSEGAEALLQFAEQTRHTLMPQWIGQLVARPDVPSRQQLLDTLVERMEERLYGEEDGGSKAAPAELTALRGGLLLRGRFSEGSFSL